MNKRESDDKALAEKENQLAELFNEYYPRLAGYAFNRTGDRAAAEDIAGEVFLKALKAMPSYRDRGLPMGAWLFRIAHNLVVDYHRQRGRRPEIEIMENILVSEESPTARLEQEHEVGQVMAAMKRLSPAQQEVLRLRFAGELSSKDIACLLGKSDGAVREMQREALSRLRMILNVDKANR